MFRYIAILSVATLCLGFPHFIDEDAIPVYRTRRDMFGGRQSFPNGGFGQTVGVRQGPVFGSVSQGFNRHGMGGPQTFGGGLSSHGVTVGGSKTPSYGGQVFAQGSVPIVNTPNHKMDAWARHENNFNKNGQRMFETNSAGVNYQHKDGFGASASRSQVPGRKPNDQFEISYSKTF